MINLERFITDCIENANVTDSHTELDYHTFHPSQLAMCKRQMVLSKLGIIQHNPELLGIFRMGTLMHEFLEKQMPQITELEVITETPISNEYETKNSNLPNINVVGSADLYFPNFDLVVDYKSQNGWYYFNPHEDSINKKERHLKQLSIYMDALEADKGKIVYLDKGKFEPKQVPIHNNEFLSKNQELITESLNNASKVIYWLTQEGYPEDISDIPFEKCGCFVCDSESDHTTNFSHIP